MSKKERQTLRQDMKRILKNLDERWVRAGSGEICENLTELIGREEFQTRNELLAWTRFFAGEADLTGFISKHLQSRMIYLPRSLPDFSMNFVAVGEDWTESLMQGQFGIPEPTDSLGQLFDPALGHESIVLVPGLCFDKQGNRLGRGKGYYDRFLGQEKMQGALKVGIAWSLQISEQIPVESHDIPVDWICHERGVMKTDHRPLASV